MRDPIIVCVAIVSTVGLVWAVAWAIVQLVKFRLQYQLEMAKLPPRDAFAQKSSTDYVPDFHGYPSIQEYIDRFAEGRNAEFEKAHPFPNPEEEG